MLAMQLNPQNKLMLLLVSLDNPLWSRILPPEEKTLACKIKDVMGVAHGTIANWSKGYNISPALASKAFAKIENKIEDQVESKEDIKHLKNTIKAFKEIYFCADNDSIPEAAKTLSIPIDRYQKIIDEAIYARLPLLPSMCYRGKQEADGDLADLGGLHYAWMRRGPLWLRCPLHVRYVLKIQSGFCIRCEMKLPMIEQQLNQTYWDYDGFVVVKDHKNFWTFQKRGQRRIDFVHFITCAARIYNSELTMAGKYLTIGQDANDSVVSDDLFIRQVQADDYLKITECMHTDSAVLEAAESKPIEQLWEGFSSDATPAQTQKAKRPSKGNITSKPQIPKKTNAKKRQSNDN